jgi:hypothetical protein
MVKFILAAVCYFGILFAFLYLIPNDQDQLRAELALDQVEFNQSLPELADLRKVENSP